MRYGTPVVCMNAYGDEVYRTPSGMEYDPDYRVEVKDCEHRFDDAADEPDRCVECDELVCPDCDHVVDYNPDSGRYWHRDGSACWLHGGDPL